LLGFRVELSYSLSEGSYLPTCKSTQFLGLSFINEYLPISE
jgi:hypothetical protein